MKLKERIRIALQVLFKGTCKELQEAEREKMEAVRMADVFEQSIRMMDEEKPLMLACGSVVGRIGLSDTDVRFIHPTERGYYSSQIPGVSFLYSLQNIEDRFVYNAAKHNANELEYLLMEVARKIAKCLIRKGLLKMEVHPSDVDCNVKTLYFSVPYYRLQK